MIQADIAKEQVLKELVKVVSRPKILRQLVDNINEMGTKKLGDSMKSLHI